MSTSSEFLWRRFHSLMGLWLVLYLAYHLLVNSQAALLFGGDAHTFVRMVNTLEGLPYLHLAEALFIGVPLVGHGVWGIKRALEAKLNRLPYERNHAFRWQRVTSWILLIGVVGHVVQMRFVYQPRVDERGRYWVEVTKDEKVSGLVEKVGAEVTLMPNGFLRVSAPTPGPAMLFMVRDTFKSGWMQALYTVFVIAAGFHACNGLWTALITWGAILSYRSQRAMIPVGWLGATVLSLLGLATIWGSR